MTREEELELEIAALKRENFKLKCWWEERGRQIARLETRPSGVPIFTGKWKPPATATAHKPARVYAASISLRVAERVAAKASKDYERADAIRAELNAEGIILTDRADGTTTFY